MDQFTEEQKYANYMFLLETIDFLNGKDDYTTITSEWGVKQIQFINSIYMCFEMEDGLEHVNAEIEDLEFRNRAKHASLYLQTLMSTIQEWGTFDIETYEHFLYCIKFLVEFSMTETQIDECIELFNKGKMIT